MENPEETCIWRIENPHILDKLIAIYGAHCIPLVFRYHCRLIIEDYVINGYVNPNPENVSASRELVTDLQNQFNDYFSTLPHYERHQLSRFRLLLNTRYSENPEELANLLKDLYSREIELILENILTPQENPPEDVEMDTNEDSPHSAPLSSEIDIVGDALGAFSSNVAEEAKKFVQNLRKFHMETHGSSNSIIHHQLDELVKQFETKLLKQLRCVFEDWEAERSKCFKLPESNNMVDKQLKNVIETAGVVQEMLYEFKRCGNYMKDNRLFSSEADCEQLFANLEKFQVQLFFITCIFVHIGGNEEYHNPILHKPNMFPVSASILSLPKGQRIDSVSVEIRTEEKRKSILDGIVKILAAKTPDALTQLLNTLKLQHLQLNADLSGDGAKKNKGHSKGKNKEGTVSGNNFSNPVGVPILKPTNDELHSEVNGPVQYKFPKFKLTGGSNRAGKLIKKRQLVTDDRYYLLVQFNFTLDGKSYHVWRVSSPIIITTNTSQDMNAWSTLFSTAFISDKVPIKCGVLLKNLCDFYFNFTGIRLGRYQEDHLTSMLTRYSTKGSWTLKQLVKTQVLSKDGNKTFTLWEWFYKSACLHKMFPKEIAQQIHGFINREDAEELLKQKPNLTFIIKFSESIPGELACVCISRGEIKYARIPTGDNDEKKQKITAMKKVDKYIKGTAELLYLYPDTMKHSLKFVETPEKEKTSHYLSLYYHIFEEIIFFRSRRSETERS